MKKTVLVGAALSVFLSCGTAHAGLWSFLKDLRRERIIFTWVDASGGFYKVGGSSVTFQSEAKADILAGLTEFVKNDYLAAMNVTPYRLILGVLTAKINSDSAVIFNKNISSQSMRDMKGNLEMIRTRLVEPESYLKTDIFGSFRVMEATLKTLDPEMKNAPYYAVYYSDMKDTRSWLQNDGTPAGLRDAPGPEGFEYLKRVKFYGVFADSVATDRYGSREFVAQWLEKLGVHVRFITLAEYNSKSARESAWMKCVKDSW